MGMQARSDLSAAKKRVKESEERVDVKLPEYLKKKYWCGPFAYVLLIVKIEGAFLLQLPSSLGDRQVGGLAGPQR